MSNVFNINQNLENNRREQASGWIAKLDRGLTDKEHDELHVWVSADPNNEIELQSQAALWDKMDVLSRLSELFPHNVPVPIMKSSQPMRRMGLAAAIGVFVIVGILLINSGVPGEQFPTENTAYETAIGGRSVINLTDGSILTLNTNSRVEVIFRDQNRDILLKYGEIHIDVAHDPSRPLRVFAGGRIVQAVGTAFSVKIDASQRVEVLVADGRVKIGLGSEYADDSYTSKKAASRAENQSIFVAEGERVVLDTQVESLEVLEPEEIDVHLSWRKGNLVFRGESLRNAAAEVGRYTSIEFVFLDENLKKIRVAGLFKAGDVNGFLNTLEANFNISYRRVGDQTILLSANKSLNDEPVN